MLRIRKVEIQPQLYEDLPLHDQEQFFAELLVREGSEFEDQVVEKWLFRLFDFSSYETAHADEIV